MNQSNPPFLIQSQTETTLVTAGHSRKAIRLFCGALFLGAVGCWLFRKQPAGINVLLWMSLLFWTTTSILGRSGELKGNKLPAMLVLPVLFSALFAWRASPTLNLLAGISLLILFGGTLIPRNFWTTTISRGCTLVFESIGFLLAGFPHLLKREINWNETSERSVWRKAGSATIGLLIAAPFLAVFAALFSSADAVFKLQIARLFDFNFEELFGNLVWTTAICWVTAGYLRRILFPEDPSTDPVDTAQTRTLGSIELNTALVALNALFLCFVLVQLRYLFGGAEVVKLTPDLSYAEYARRGFFELVTASVLVLPLLLLADWLFPAGQPKRTFRFLSTSLIALLFVIMTSAMKRMLMYQSEYGQTELRFYVSAFMMLMFAIFLWFCLTVSRGRRERFLSGSLVLVLASVVVLHAVNPDAWILRTNLARAAEGKKFDVAHTAELSADGIPVLLAGLSQLSVADQAEWSRRFQLKRYQNVNIRSWNWSRFRAELSIKGQGLNN